MSETPTTYREEPQNASDGLPGPVRRIRSGTLPRPPFWILDSEANTLDEIAMILHRNSMQKGWWDTDRNDGEILALIHSEVSEALEALREGNQESEHLPGFTALEEELADVMIRVLDYACARGCRIGEALQAKHTFNCNRPFRHGKAF